MKHPFQLCSTYHCCCCVINPLLTQYIIAIICIIINSFASLAVIGIRDYIVVALQVFNFILHLGAGIFLFLGAIWRKNSYKTTYCWLVFFGIFTLVVYFIIHGLYFLDSEEYCLDFNGETQIALLFCHAVWLIGWDIYTPMVILGTMNKTPE